ncbi:hypothetical protein NCH01_03890 [Neoasaia chiangmaiensis]|nr:hypothetical protein [Neoasaia chiangmaiensis]GEN13958.1 hypothetical protein NCH01_03890 [Neoasaia chiangmaiensis]
MYDNGQDEPPSWTAIGVIAFLSIAFATVLVTAMANAGPTLQFVP